MIDISSWLDSFLQALDARFGERVWYVVLQGSYARGEATEASDIDMVVILDELSAFDTQSYNNMLDALPIENWFAVSAQKNEILNWEASDLFNSIIIRPDKGNLDELLPRGDDAAMLNDSSWCIQYTMAGAIICCTIERTS